MYSLSTFLFRWQRERFSEVWTGLYLKQCFTRHIVGDSVHAGRNDTIEHRFILLMPKRLCTYSLVGYKTKVAALTSDLDVRILIN
jgi:hypothetical protein